MTRSELLAKIAAEPNGVWKSKNGLRFNKDTNSIEARWKNGAGPEFMAFLMDHKEDDMLGWHLCNANDLKDANDLLAFLGFLSADTEAGVRIDNVHEVEKVVTIRDEKEEARLRGQVEVYERIVPTPKRVTLE